jgi:hypothetical protein
MQLRLATVFLSFGIVLSAAPGPGALAVLCAEAGGSTCGGQVGQLVATGLFTSVDGFGTQSATPALSAISGYGAVLAGTDGAPTAYPPADPVALGNLLASYYNLGGKHLTVGAYAYGGSTAIAGQVTTSPWAAFTTGGAIADVSGNLSAVVPSDSIFAGITLSGVVYTHDASYAHPGLAAGATLLATDGAGVNMIARSANGVIGFNMYTGSRGQKAAFYTLVAQTLLDPPAPSITGVNPASGAPGTPVTITGTNFGAAQGTVTIGGVAATVTSWSATSITVTVPAGAATGNVVVSTALGLPSAGAAFTVTAAAAAVPALGPAAGLLLIAGLLALAFLGLRPRQMA